MCVIIMIHQQNVYPHHVIVTLISFHLFERSEHFILFNFIFHDLTK